MDGRAQEGSAAIQRASAGDRRPRLDSLTSLRFFAALFVVVHHVTRVYDPIPIVSDLFELGGAGVSFFFVLSGFVLTWSHSGGQRASRFYRNRFARVYPLHLLTLLVAGAVLLWQGQSRTPLVVLASLLLVQAWIPAVDFLRGVNGPSWSLSSEAFFYAVFPLARARVVRLAPSSLIALAVGAVAAAAIIAVGLRFAVGGDTVNYFLYMDPAYRFWEFLVGVVTAVLLMRTKVRMPSLRIAVLVALGAYVLVAVLDAAVVHHLGPLARVPFQSFPSDLVAIGLTPLFAVLIAAAARSDLAGGTSVLRSRALIRLGTWSFALYLTHLVLISALQPFVPRSAPLLVAVLIAAGTIAAAVLLSGAAYHLFERPAERLIRSGFRNRSA